MLPHAGHHHSKSAATLIGVVQSIACLAALGQVAQAANLSVNHCLQASCKTYLQIDVPAPFAATSGSLQLATGDLCCAAICFQQPSRHQS